MKVVIVNCFDTYEDRIDLLYDFFTNKGHNVTVIQSDFRHVKKIYRTESKQDFIFVKSKSYYKNMSLARLISHYSYAKKAFKLVEELKPDLLYVVIPPNSLAKFAAEYKRKNSSVKLIFDLIDVWPETMPVGKIKTMLPFKYWRLMRDKSLKFADYVITECDLYQSILKDVVKDTKIKTLYLAKKDIKVSNYSYPLPSTDQIQLCYLGSINNIIDISKIKAIVKSIHELKPVTVHIIGDGESKDNLVNEIKSAGATVEYYGKIYEPQKKQYILSKCHFALNIMKNNVCVGLTMKSIDYFQHGLPILNNIQADTTEIVEQYKVGINVTDENIKSVALEITNVDLKELQMFRENSLNVFHNLFSISIFNQKLECIMNDL